VNIPSTALGLENGRKSEVWRFGQMDNPPLKGGCLSVKTSALLSALDRVSQPPDVVERTKPDRLGIGRNRTTSP